jgi:hypothetical protein
MAARSSRGATATIPAPDGWRAARDAAPLHQLAATLSGGWLVWWTSTAPHWRAAPGPAGGSTSDAIAAATPRNAIVGAPTPEQLAATCDQRYGWDATCTTCNRPARECGHTHRTP